LQIKKDATQLAPFYSSISSYFIGFKSIPRIVIVMLLMGLQSIPANMVNIAHRSLMSDSIDYVEYTTGKRTEGITFSMQNFATKVGEALSLFISGKLLTAVGYNQNIGMTAQGAVFMKWQWPMFILGPVVGAILYLAVIVFVKDDKEQRKQIETELKLRREKMVENAEAELESING
jgi:Na+/melibiose symporter-like transporter